MTSWVEHDVHDVATDVTGLLPLWSKSIQSIILDLGNRSKITYKRAPVLTITYFGNNKTMEWSRTQTEVIPDSRE